MIATTVPRQDVLLCLLHGGATPGGEWLDVGALVEAHYGETTGTARQGRRQAMRNILWGLYDAGLVLRWNPEDGDVCWQLTPRAMSRMIPSGQ